VFLAIDIGNTTILLGLYKGERLLSHERLHTAKEADSSFYESRLLEFFSSYPKEEISECMISSVVPPLDPVLKRAIRRCLGIDPTLFDPASSGMPILCKGVGSDRVLNAIGGFEAYGGPLIIVDFGTATTFDVVSGKGEYLGGVICPGVNSSAQAMWQDAYNLYEVELTKPQAVISKDTTSAMQAGIFYGTVAQVEGVVERITNELPSKPKVVATGGLAPLFAPSLNMVEEVDPFLVLRGLRIVSRRIKREAKG
jgi:type III pantothenate kinase